MTYTVLLTHDPDGKWCAELKEISEVHTYGRTIEQALERLREALWVWTDDRELAFGATLVAKLSGLPKTVVAQVAKATAEREKAETAQAAASASARKTAAALAKRGLSARDIGYLLGVSRQRAHKLLETG